MKQFSLKHCVLAALALLLSSPLLAISAISGPIAVCVGATASFGDATPGGLWTSSSPTIATVGLHTGIVTGVAEGPVTITYSAGGSYVTANVRIIPSPDPISGTSWMLPGSSTTLSDASPAGTWSSSHPAVAPVSGGIVSGSSLGTATIYYTNSTGCQAAMTVTVLATAPCSGTPVAGTATASTTYYTGGALTLNLTGCSTAAGITYQWEQSNDSVSFTAITGATNTVYTYTPYSAAYYRCQVRCGYSGISAYSNTVFVMYQYKIIVHTITSTSSTTCSSPLFTTYANGFSSWLRLKTYYGDGHSDSVSMSTSGVHSYVSHSYSYTSPGTYSVKSVLYYRNMPQDSAADSYESGYCKCFPVKLFYDANYNGIMDPTEHFNSAPLLVQVDSNGITVGVESVTGGLYYMTNAPVGTIYKFSILPGGFYASSPVSGIIYDTVLATTTDYPAKYFGLNCSGSGSIDLGINQTMDIIGGDDEWGYIYIYNSYCTPANGTVTMHFSPKYEFTGEATPTPSFHSGTTIQWDVTGVTSTATSPLSLYFKIYKAGSTEIPVGDTLNESYAVACTSGTDINLTNNEIIKVDTCRQPYDPNEMSVTPGGCIPSGIAPVQLQYTVNFENTGNAPTHNIYVLDTLPGYLDAASLRIVMSSHAMNIWKDQDERGYTIVRFDFPSINLLDSSHHGQCDGSIIFTVNTTGGLSAGTQIVNRAGIYFDYNPVVMTNSAQSGIGCEATNVPVVGNASDIQLIPNPATSSIKLISSQLITTVSVCNLLGQEVFMGNFNSNDARLDIAGLEPGMYLVKINGSEVKRFLKQ